MALSVGEIVRQGEMVKFVCLRKGNMYYETVGGFVFPVPLEDIGDATFQAAEKSLLLMRYIRMHVETINAGKNQLPGS